MIVTWEIVKITSHHRTMSLWDYFKWKGLQSIFHCKRGNHIYRNPGVTLSSFLFTWWNPIIVHDVSIILVLWPYGLTSRTAYLFLCVGRGLVRLGSTTDLRYLAESNRLWDFKFARIMRSRYLVPLYICYILLNVRDNKLIYSNI